MVTHKKKTYYAVAIGKGEPMICTWGIAAPLVKRYSGAKYRGFPEFQEARKWMEGMGCTTFHFSMPTIDGEIVKIKPKPTGPLYYAVASGLKPGVYDTWAEAEQQVKGQPSNCHKGFPTRDAAQLFLDEYNMAGRAARAGAPPKDVVSSISEGVERLTLDYSSSGSSRRSDSDSEAEASTL